MLVFKKIMMNKKNKILCLLILLGISILFISYETVGLHNTEKTNLKHVTQLNIKNSKKAIGLLSDSLKENLSIDEKKNTEKQLADAKKSLELEKSKLEAINSKNYNRFYELDHSTYSLLMKRLDEDPTSAAINNDFVKSYNSWYLKVKASGQNFAEAMGANASGIGAVSYILMTLGGLFGLVAFTLIVGDSLSSEFPNGLRYFHLMRWKKSKIQFQYFFIPLVIVAGGLSTVLIFVFLIATMQYGIGSPDFPQLLIGAKFQRYAGEILIWQIVYLIAALVFITTLGQLISQIVKKAYISSAIIILILVGYSTLQTQESMKNVIKWVPLTYLNVNTVFNLSDGTKNWPDSGNYLFGQNSLWIGLITILLCSIVFYLVTHVLFKQYIYRKDLDK